MTKIKFKDLNNWLKAVVIAGWIAIGYWAIVFLIAFVIELI